MNYLTASLRSPSPSPPRPPSPASSPPTPASPGRGPGPLAVRDRPGQVQPRPPRQRLAPGRDRPRQRWRLHAAGGGRRRLGGRQVAQRNLAWRRSIARRAATSGQAVKGGDVTMTSRSVEERCRRSGQLAASAGLSAADAAGMSLGRDRRGEVPQRERRQLRSPRGEGLPPPAPDPGHRKAAGVLCFVRLLAAQQNAGEPQAA